MGAAPRQTAVALFAMALAFIIGGLTLLLMHARLVQRGDERAILVILGAALFVAGSLVGLLGPIDILDCTDCDRAV